MSDATKEACRNAFTLKVVDELIDDPKKYDAVGNVSEQYKISLHAIHAHLWDGVRSSSERKLKTREELMEKIEADRQRTFVHRSHNPDVRDSFQWLPSV